MRRWEAIGLKPHVALKPPVLSEWPFPPAPQSRPHMLNRVFNTVPN
jgi:hypothetical protein